MPSKKIPALGDRRELFVDDLLVETLDRTWIQLHAPQPREAALVFDRPWEGPATLYQTLIRDGGRVLLYYRGWSCADTDGSAVYCVAESSDGIRFTRPSLDLHPQKNARRNNIILADVPGTHNLAPFLDTNPAARPAERFKALASGPRRNRNQPHNLVAFTSPDGFRWAPLRKRPVLVNDTPRLAFDSQNVSFWSAAEQQYVAYYRTWSARRRMAPTSRRAAPQIRRISRATSPDFRHWSGSTEMQYRTWGRTSPMEEFYTSQTLPYFRAPHLYIALPARFLKNRRALTEAEAESLGVHPTQRNDCSDACFMTTRPGRDYYDRTCLEAWHRPPCGPAFWSARNNYPASGVIQTGPDEMSVYIDDHYHQPGNTLRRYALRLDGFLSVRAPHGGGEMRTRPFTFAGGELELNYATSAAGELRVEIQDAQGAPIAGHTLREAADLFGNQVAGRARWKGGTGVAALAGRPVRLRFVMRDADLYSLRFVKTGA